MQVSQEELTILAATLIVFVFLYTFFDQVLTLAKLVVRSHMVRLKLRQIDEEMQTGRMSAFEMWMRKGDVHFHLQSWHKAISYYREAALAHPLNAPIHLKLGLAYLMDRFFHGREVEDTLRRALERKDSLTEANFMLAMFYMDIGLFSQARQELRKFPPEEVQKNLTGRMLRDLAKDDLERDSTDGYVYSRSSWREKFLLALLYFFFFFFLCSFLIVGVASHLHIALALLPVIVLVHFVCARFVHISREGIFYYAPFSRVSIPWQDIEKLTRESEGMLSIVLKGKSISFTRAWDNFDDLAKRIKLELYHRDWSG